ncbi:phosphotransferase [Streptomyces sp. NPDC005811]|uniref:phosphotransferase n=1 Tax=Streptomyces sp. NPDC005811 TaxID=3154565 RepID=UPI003400BC05
MRQQHPTPGVSWGAEKHDPAAARQGVRPLGRRSPVIQRPFRRMSMPEAVIVSAARSPIGRAVKGSLGQMRPDDLALQMVRAALTKVPELDLKDVVDLMLGCGQPAGESGHSLARVVAVQAGLDGLPGVTVNRYCSSSLQTTRMAFHAIKAGEGDTFVSAGVETVSRYPRGRADGLPGTDNPPFGEALARTDRRGQGSAEPWRDPRADGGLPDVYISMGKTAENVAQHLGMSREEQDRFAVRSQDKVRFPAPVPVGSRLQGRVHLASLEPAGYGYRLTTVTTVERANGSKPVCVAESLSRLVPVPGALPGLDLDRLAYWLRRNIPGIHFVELTAELVTGGRSNLTYTVWADDQSWILRRPPLGHVLTTAHDMAREYRIMSALAPTPVPVPRTISQCTDPDILGAPFYLMERVMGTPYRRAPELASLGPERTRAIATELVDTLVELYRVDHLAIGLGEGRPNGFLARQVRRWKAQLDASRTRELPDVDRLFAKLSKRVPVAGPVGVVHGGYRLDNLLVDDEDRPAALIDWEMSTIGDPLTDLALTVVYQRVGSMPGGEAVADASSAPGFLPEPEILERYAARSGRDLNDFGFYLGLAGFKLAGILEGIHARLLRGQTVGPGFDGVGAVTEPLLAAVLTSLQEYS